MFQEYDLDEGMITVGMSSQGRRVIPNTPEPSDAAKIFAAAIKTESKDVTEKARVLLHIRTLVESGIDPTTIYTNLLKFKTTLTSEDVLLLLAEVCPEPSIEDAETESFPDTKQRAKEIIDLLVNKNRLLDPEILDVLSEITFDPITYHYVAEYLKTKGLPERVLKTVILDHVRSTDDTANYEWDELEVMDDLQVNWIVDGLFFSGSTSILSGIMKSGKSNFVRSLLYSLATGEPFLGHTVIPQHTMYLCLEDSKVLFVPAMRKLFDDPRSKKRTHRMITRFSVNPSKLVKELEWAVEQGVTFFIIDTVIKALSVTDTNSYAEMSLALDTLTRFAKKHHIHLLLLHHNNKASSDRGASAGMMGSAAIPAASDCNIIIAKSEENGTRSIFSENRIPTHLGGKVFSGEKLNVDQQSFKCYLTRPETKEEKKMTEEMGVYFLIANLLRDTPTGVSKKHIKDTIPKGKDIINKVIEEGLDKQVFLLNEENKVGGYPSLILTPLLVNATEEQLQKRMEEYLQR